MADRRRPARLRRGRLRRSPAACAPRSTRRWRARARSSTCSRTPSGPYPFSTVGAIVDNQDDLFFALETQTRPVYSKLFWLDNEGNPVNGDCVVVHELAHQWFGDDVALARWQDIWLNEGFATYAEWLWAEHEGRRRRRRSSRPPTTAIPADDPFWAVVIGDPGVDMLFDNAVYVRGAMTLQALRNEVGDDAFFEIVAQWAPSKSGGNGTTRGVHRAGRAGLGRAARRAVRRSGCSPAKPGLEDPARDRRAGSERALVLGRLARSGAGAAGARPLLSHPADAGANPGRWEGRLGASALRAQLVAALEQPQVDREERRRRAAVRASSESAMFASV